jgi:sugar phosphate isomerase/epimerase
MSTVPDLLATCWTSAGDAEPWAGLGPNREVSPHGLRERVEAVTAAGWKGFGLVNADLAALKKSMTLGEMKSIFDDYGVTRVQLEFLNDWWTTGQARDESDAVRRELLDAATVFGASEIKVAGAYAWTEAPNMALLEDEFGALAEQARQAGTRIALEPLPFSNFSTVESGAAFADRVGHPNGGIIVDVWHVFRGGSTFESLAAASNPGNTFAVELNDALSATPDDLWVDTIHHRRVAGEGEWDLAGFIRTMRSTGFDGTWGVEILSEEFRKEELASAVRRAFEATVAVFERS